METIDIFLKNWWIILLVLSMPYFIFFIINLWRIKKLKSGVKLEHIHETILVQSEEQIHLGISIKNSDIKFYKERIEQLIILLNESKDKVSVNAVEAILIVELFADSVLVNEQGELVVDIKTAKEFSQTIYHDPMKFITYIKSIETRIDINNPKNKIELSDVLYMMRNAKKFGLYINEEDTDAVFKIKSAIHESNYKDVVIKIVEDVETEREISSNTNVILNNVHENVTDKNNFIDDGNIKSVERLDNNRVKLIMKDGTQVVKDDFVIYEAIPPESEDEPRKNSQERKEQLHKVLNEESNSTIQEYVSRFGQLDMHEKANLDKFIFKDRALKFYNEDIFAYKLFAPEDFHSKNFFNGDEKFYHHFVSTLFNKEFAIYNSKPFIFIGDTLLKNDKTIRFVTIDAYYFLALVYSSIVREHRESFFHFIFDGKKIKEENLNLFLENINNELDFFHPTKECFVFDVVYIYIEKTISTKMINLKIDVLKNLIDKNEDIRNSYAQIKRELDGKIKVRAFGAAVQNNSSADIKYSHDTFFRLPLEERVF